jgi:signal transduction histidine kinase
MSVISTIKQLRSDLFSAIMQATQGESSDLATDDQVNRFLDLLEKSLEYDDQFVLTPLLEDWSQSQTTSNIATQTAVIPRLIDQMVLAIVDTIKIKLPPQAATDLIVALQPAFNYAFVHSCDLEIKTHLNFVTNQLKVMTQSMDRMERSKSDFIAVAAHELRTPLTLIEGYIVMLDERIHNMYPNFTNHDYISGIRNGAHRMRATIDDMIDVSIIDNNLLQLNFQPIWIDRLINSLVSDLQSTIVERQITLTVGDMTGIGVINYGDPDRLLQLFRNLLTNAIKYTPDGGKVHACGKASEQAIEIMIQDTGIGIDAGDQAAIFEKFGQVGNPSLHSSGRTKFKGGGAGLGLYIARGIAEAHGGAIWVESPGRDEIKLPGSTFHVVLPKRDVPPDKNMAAWFKTISQES